MRNTLDMSTAQQRFDEIIGRLVADFGWTHLRVDTLVHPSHGEDDRRKRPTIRHSYVAGTWTLTLEPDRNWRRAHPDANTEPVPWTGTEIKLVAGQELPTVDQVLSQFNGALGAAGW